MYDFINHSYMYLNNMFVYLDIRLSHVIVIRIFTLYIAIGLYELVNRHTFGRKLGIFRSITQE